MLVKLILTAILFLFFSSWINITSIYAVVNPLEVPNNKFGIHIIQATPEESSPAAQLVNSSGGDWGYVTVLIGSNDRDQNKWQQFFNDLRVRHFIPLVRLATKPVNEHWERPYEGEEIAWADFLDSLIWPTKNRYVIVYNEPNHGKEWGQIVDPKLYAEVLNKTITALKYKNRDFFVLNGGFDASAPQKPPQFMDQLTFMTQMEEAVPGIFEKLDGWVSHSYPNPEFIGSPNGVGRGTVRTWFWEIQALRGFGVTKNLPIFITETGWKHAEGINYNSSYPTAERVAENYKTAFETAWASDRIVAVTPFILTYQSFPFDHFSFKKYTGEKQNVQILGAQYPDYYPQYQTILEMPKIAGKPVQENKAELTSGEIYRSIVAGESYQIPLTFKNTGQSIWNDRGQIRLMAIEGGKELGIEPSELPKGIKIEPGQQHSFNISLKAPESGTFKVVLNLLTTEGKQFDSPPLEFETEVKSPVVLIVKSLLTWKKDHSGQYLLKVEGATGESIQQITLDKSGSSSKIDARYLLPEYTFNFTLEKPFYKSSKIQSKVVSGVNVLDFGILYPDIISALLNPTQLWKLLPFSN